MKHTLLTLALLALASCAKTELHIGDVKGFTAADEATVREVLMGVNGDLGKTLIGEDSNYGIPLTVVYSNQMFLSVADMETVVGLAAPGKDGCTITLSRYMDLTDSDTVKELIYHELGHCVGLSHTTTTTDVMSPILSDTPLSQSLPHYLDLVRSVNGL